MRLILLLFSHKINSLALLFKYGLKDVGRPCERPVFLDHSGIENGPIAGKAASGLSALYYLNQGG